MKLKLRLIDCYVAVSERTDTTFEVIAAVMLNGIVKALNLKLSFSRNFSESETITELLSEVIQHNLSLYK